MQVPLKCAECPTVHKLTNPEDIDGSFRELRAAGWLDVATKGLGRERWPWCCPTCKPTGEATTTGFTKGRPTTKKSS
jgi:hypothetical protein